ncbi:ImmA/IrrE family metallo-endopeptidase [Campylobacter showae]|uniref:ImmA/IrrE family metallo-endopeptidase n=1 Tax=Campylobacter showae TaxID=204 RepID=UPI0028D7D0C2|nr:ImmA/IrrE family metallo-endopeptidase [Campylobacter showae]
MRTNEAFITPSVLEWAIKRAGVSAESIHKKAEQWVSGKARPTFKQAVDLAKTLQIPFGYLWLKEPPKEQKIIPDLRTIGNGGLAQMPLELKTAVNDVKQKQEWFKEYAKTNGILKCEAIGRFKVSDDTQEIADDVTARLEIQDLVGSGCDKDRMLKNLIEKIEKLGILVMRNSILRGNTKKKLNLDTFRGFAILDEFAPLIFINTNDSKAGQIFTLMHEVAHLWIGQSGISDLDIRENNKIELACNEIAAKILMPKTKIQKAFREFDDDRRFERIADRFSVSTLAVLNRLRSLSLLAPRRYQELYNAELERLSRIPKTRPSGAPPPEVMVRVRNGYLFTFAVTSSVLSGDETYTNGASLLGFKNTDLINKVAKEIRS